MSLLMNTYFLLPSFTLTLAPGCALSFLFSLMFYLIHPLALGMQIYVTRLIPFPPLLMVCQVHVILVVMQEKIRNKTMQIWVLTATSPSSLCVISCVAIPRAGHALVSKLILCRLSLSPASNPPRDRRARVRPARRLARWIRRPDPLRRFHHLRLRLCVWLRRRIRSSRGPASAPYRRPSPRSRPSDPLRVSLLCLNLRPNLRLDLLLDCSVAFINLNGTLTVLSDGA
jgi:hypothetical protein